MRRWGCRQALRVAACSVAVLLLTAGAVAADEKLLLELKARVEKLEKQNEDLRKQLGTGGPYRVSTAPESASEKEKIHKVIDSYLSDKEKKKKAEDEKKAALAEAEGYEVGKQVDLRGKWVNNQYWFETEDKAFRIHVGGRTQIDAVGVHAPGNVTGVSANPANPLSVGGIGVYDDAVNFRRARLAVEGTFWEVFDFNCEYDFLNTARVVPAGSVLPAAVGGSQNLSNLSGTAGDRANVINTPVPTDLWITWKSLPVLGNIRIGNQKPWISFEHLTSSRFLDFLERSSAFDAFVENGNNGFIFGVSTFNTYADDRVFFGLGVYKPNFRDIFGWNVGDGEYLYTTRLAATPVYAERGRCLLHAGLAYQYSTADDGVIRYRARTQMRNGPALLHNTVAIIQLQAREQHVVVPELAANYGPWNVSAEYYGSWANQRPGQVFQIVGNQTAGLPGGGRGSLFYQGAYVTVGYFLTGEHRSYNIKTKAWDRQAVNENAFWVDGEDGMMFGRGAVELLARWSWLDLDDKGINGGRLQTGTFGVNWFLNPNAKLQFNYELGYRNATQYAAGTIAPGGLTSRDGIYQGFGTRFAFDW